MQCPGYSADLDPDVRTDNSTGPICAWVEGLLYGNGTGVASPPMGSIAPPGLANGSTRRMLQQSTIPITPGSGMDPCMESCNSTEVEYIKFHYDENCHD